MPSKKLMGSWAFFDFCLLTAGVVTLALSIVWRRPNLLMNMVLSQSDLTAGLILAITLLVSWIISVGAIVQPNHVLGGLYLLNWVLIIDGIFILVIGTFVWFYTLQERANYHEVFSTLSTQTRIAIQDQLKCCGYFNSSDLSEVGGTFCANQTFIDVTNNATENFCVTPITAFADMTLNNIFSTIYGYMAIVILLFLATMCIIYKRKEGERFRRIDEKRGGRGFV
ncbi:tetraspanin Pls1 family [Schizopora paradoxa]|uniref:Tetraspanin Pls1 family n=1 Tax=Schizopora paradoxa TaxID=27342 RepID=A0A0H2RTK7_9AGAM|nr:tetraspanin Pls1 family [Schizopora paradoxa]